MQSEFRGKRWIFWAKALIFLGMGGICVPLGVLYWEGILHDADGLPRPQAGPPMVIGGLVFLVVGMMAAFEVAARARPLIRCYREGVEFNLIARSSLDRVSHVPALARLAWNILSLQGIRARRVRVAWTGLESVFALDIPMGQILRIRGIAAEASGEAASTEIGFQQFELHTSVLKIASILQTLAADPSLQQQLPTWT